MRTPPPFNAGDWRQHEVGNAGTRDAAHRLRHPVLPAGTAGCHVVIKSTALHVQSANLFIHSCWRPCPPTWWQKILILGKKMTTPDDGDQSTVNSGLQEPRLEGMTFAPSPQHLSITTALELLGDIWSTLGVWWARYTLPCRTWAGAVSSGLGKISMGLPPMTRPISEHSQAQRGGRGAGGTNFGRKSYLPC